MIMPQSLKIVQVESRKAQFWGLYFLLFSLMIYQDSAQSLTFSYLQMIQRFQRNLNFVTKCRYELQSDLLGLHDWAFEYKMVFKAGKTKLRWFSLKKSDVKEQPIIVFEDEDVSFTFEPVEDPGILFASTLYWTPTLKKINDAYGHFINLKKVSPSLSQVKKSSYLPNLLSIIPWVCLSILVPK